MRDNLIMWKYLSVCITQRCVYQDSSDPRSSRYCIPNHFDLTQTKPLILANTVLPESNAACSSSDIHVHLIWFEGYVTAVGYSLCENTARVSDI